MLLLLPNSHTWRQVAVFVRNFCFLTWVMKVGVGLRIFSSLFSLLRNTVTIITTLS